MIDLHWWAPGAAAAYFAGCLAFGERFPFSRYGMYAITVGRRAGSVPLFLADGRPADIRSYVAFSGIDPRRIDPPPRTCSLEWRVHEMRRWLCENPAPAGQAPGPVKVEVAYRLLALGPKGRLGEKVLVVASGRAWPA